MSGRRAFVLAISVCLMLCAFASVASAEEANQANEHATEIFKWINFAIVALVILWVFGSVLPKKFRANAETISSAITKAAATKAEADKQLADAESRLAHLDQEVAELRATAQKEAGADAERIREILEITAV